MKTKIFAIISIVMTTLSSCSTQQAKSKSNDFITIENGHFVRSGQPYYYVGANFWYGAILASTGEGGDRARLTQELDILQNIGVDNLRILVGGDGEVGIPSRIRPTLQIEPGVYNDTILDGLDYLMAELGKRKMKAVLYLNNSWEWSGGYSVYLQWSGAGKAPIPAIDGWPSYMDYVKNYIQSDTAKQLFANHVNFILTRTNRYTHKLYTDDDAIMSWQIGNEPRCFADENKKLFVEWISNVASQIRALDSKHLISVGSEGKQGCEQDIKLYEEIHSLPNVDYLNIHLWPYNWGWASKDSLAQHLEISKRNTKTYINEHLAIAKRYSKPLVMEEFGYPRDNFKFSRESATTCRDEFYNFIFDYVVEQAKLQSNFAGCNFWAWGGTAQPSAEHIFWQFGDDYTGDPAQEEQGLNSVFDSDSTTILIQQANEKIKSSYKK